MIREVKDGVVAIIDMDMDMDGRRAQIKVTSIGCHRHRPCLCVRLHLRHFYSPASGSATDRRH